MNKFLILLSSLFALTFFGCNNDEEDLDLIDTLENEKNKEKLYLIPKTRVLIESDGPFTKIDGKKYTFNNLIKIYELVARYYNEPDIIKMVYANFRDILSK